MLKKILISVTAILIIMMGIALYQGNQLKVEQQQLTKKQKELKEKKTTVFSSGEDEALEDRYQTTLRGTDRLKALMAIVLNNDPTKYDSLAPGKVLRSAQNYLQSVNGASVDFSSRPHFEIKQVSPNTYYSMKPQYLVIGQSKEQNVAYLVDYDPYIDEIMAIKKMRIQGDFQNEK
ncbi:hypothetical protein [Fructobacillus cardui]|uniref:hypothetical protein n=1 Tax=Fructobacillus cardui TaxID=2893170 RepID=UPI002DA60AC6|nr:hypothetical protein R53653_IHELHDKM_00729 [Fructobacillus cardui]